MGKRSNFERIPRDFYPTPPEAVGPLLPHLGEWVWFVEPCAGDGALISALEAAGHTCAYACDIEPRAECITEKDALTITPNDRWVAYDFIITNPPWDRAILHSMIAHFSAIKPTWLLFDADWMHTKQSAPFMPYLHKIVSVGRVKWIPDSTMTGKDNCCWYLFDQTSEAAAQFIGRAA
jgi:hypothetical protein